MARLFSGDFRVYDPPPRGRSVRCTVDTQPNGIITALCGGGSRDRQRTSAIYRFPGREHMCHRCFPRKSADARERPGKLENDQGRVVRGALWSWYILVKGRVYEASRRIPVESYCSGWISRFFPGEWEFQSKGCLLFVSSLGSKFGFNES